VLDAHDPHHHGRLEVAGLDRRFEHLGGLLPGGAGEIERGDGALRLERAGDLFLGGAPQRRVLDLDEHHDLPERGEVRAGLLPGAHDGGRGAAHHQKRRDRGSGHGSMQCGAHGPQCTQFPCWRGGR